jgi:hypothetical protein
MLFWELIPTLLLVREGLIGNKTLNYLVLTESQRKSDILKIILSLIKREIQREF